MIAIATVGQWLTPAETNVRDGLSGTAKLYGDVNIHHYVGDIHECPASKYQLHSVILHYPRSAT